MTFNKYYFLFFLTSLLACQEKPPTSLATDSPPTAGVDTVFVLADELNLKANEGLVYYRGQPFTGTSIERYPNGQLAVKTPYWEGKKQGLEQKWFSEGLLSFSSNYLAGKRHGITQSWWINGNLRSESHFIHGTGNGVQRQWYQSGTLFKKLQLTNGKEEGLQQSWRENGKIYNNYEAKDGRIYGLKRGNLCYELEDEIVQY